MSMLGAQRTVIVTALDKYIEEGNREFTAQDFIERCEQDDYEEYGIDKSQQHDVASHMRALFNAGNPLFAKFGCMKVNGNSGPLLFFKVWPSSRAGRKAKAVKTDMDQATTDDDS